ncbi:hypothetical protein DSO57_1036945 [Entomophthora muscae]|uniref:Uncharacterized protein n=1 Tax=Entomophthora muscae TaxID=34485 RepID=A0ACC2SZY7_9FUNG|nr:hypothetical protein DSO57_1036945 [Entomophthora muscae]
MSDAYAKLVRRVDARIIPFIFVLHLASFLDRVNIGHARLYGMEAAIGITSSQYAVSLSIFFVGYVLFEVPSNLMMKQTTAPRWIGSIMVAWGLATMFTAAVNNYSQLLVIRILLGVAESGFFPGMIHYLSFWYSRRQQGLRIAMLTCASTVASCISGPISYSISSLDGHWLRSWQWVFVIEGAPTILLGIVTVLLMPSSPKDAKWLSPAESDLLAHHLTASHVEIHASRFDKKQFIQAFTDYKTYMYMALYFTFMCPMYSTALLMPTIVKDLGFETATTMLLTAPPYLCAIIFNLTLAYNSDRTMNRSFHVMFAALFASIGFLTLLLAKTTALRYAAICFVACGVSSATAPTLSWVNNNLVGSTRAATASALIIMFGNCGGILAGQFYSQDEAPTYFRSHTINLALLCATLLLSLTLRFLLANENHTMDNNHRSDKQTTEFRYIL